MAFVNTLKYVKWPKGDFTKNPKDTSVTKIGHVNVSDKIFF